MEKKEQFFKTMNDYHKRLKEYVKSGDLEKDQNPDEWLWNRIKQELFKEREKGKIEIIDKMMSAIGGEREFLESMLSKLNKEE
jgi:hypothetical protein